MRTAAHFVFVEHILLQLGIRSTFSFVGQWLVFLPALDRFNTAPYDTKVHISSPISRTKVEMLQLLKFLALQCVILISSCSDCMWDGLSRILRYFHFLAKLSFPFLFSFVLVQYHHHPYSLLSLSSPGAYVLPAEYPQLLSDHVALSQEEPIYISKPVGLSRGRGIAVFKVTLKTCYY